MNSDQVKGAAKKVAGKVQEEAGKLVGSKEQQIKGAAKQVEGSVLKGFGNLKEALKDNQKH
ncbi:CsbD family protein [Undibacterium pigrum]|uniref:CsbD-like protein n=1 Tax=Undibacterium pigrum TaxID=401470 RepID=A0A318J8F4_9BURK|nr:CsbD family protein [Undibacterium pigrum]PXX43031.1 CsbD-like protein [Undibacterium pigrum]